MFKFLNRKKSQKDLLVAAMKKQRDYDKQQEKKALAENDNKWHKELQFQRDSYEAQLRMKDEEISGWEARKSSLEEREYLCRRQIGINYHIAQRITLKTQNASEAFVKEIGEIQGCFDDAKTHHDDIKKLEIK